MYGLGGLVRIIALSQIRSLTLYLVLKHTVVTEIIRFVMYYLLEQSSETIREEKENIGKPITKSSETIFASFLLINQSGCKKP